jgi:hypothetical protein
LPEVTTMIFAITLTLCSSNASIDAQPASP